MIVSGVVTKGNADFKSDAVKVAHEKPVPQHEKRPPSSGNKSSMVIQQPRKQWSVLKKYLFLKEGFHVILKNRKHVSEKPINMKVSD